MGCGDVFFNVSSLNRAVVLCRFVCTARADRDIVENRLKNFFQMNFSRTILRGILGKVCLVIFLWKHYDYFKLSIGVSILSKVTFFIPLIQL